MFRQASRNQRSKGLKVKHVVQICLLLAVCFWLLYQVKHSHDKKKAFDESNAKISEHIQQGQEILKFGRKDLNERGAVSSSMIEQSHVDEENEEEDENKHEAEDENKHEAEDEGKEDERRGGGDDEIDEHDQEKSIEESERQEDIEDEGKDEEEIKEKEEKEEEENHGKQENEEEEENKENEEGEENKEIAESEDTEERKENSQEAREAQYNGDDASSAVVKESVNMEGENMNPGISGNEQRDIPEKDTPEVVSNINATIGSSFDQDGSNTSSILKISEKNDNPEKDAVGSDSETTTMVDSSFNQNGTNTSSLVETAEKPAENGTDTKEKAGNIGLSVMGNETITSPILENEVDNVTLSNSTVENEPNDGVTKLQSQGNETLSRSPTESSTQVFAENLGNETMHVEPDQHQNMTLGAETTTDVADPERQSVLLEQTETSNSTKGEGQNQIGDKDTPTGTGDGINGNSTDAIGELESDKNVTSLILDENSDKLLLETTDTKSSSVTQEVKEALTDLGTLPETGMEGHSENISAE